MQDLSLGQKVYLVNGAFTPNLPKSTRSDDGLTVGEVVLIFQEGKELVYRVRVALEDGTLTYHELIWVGQQLVRIVRIPAVQEAAKKTGGLIMRTLRRWFGLK